MPKDQWAKESRRIESHKRMSGRKSYRPKRIKMHNPKEIPAGTSVLARRGEKGRFGSKTFSRKIAVTHFIAETDKALLVESDKWMVWVRKEILVDFIPEVKKESAKDGSLITNMGESKIQRYFDLTADDGGESYAKSIGVPWVGKEELERIKADWRIKEKPLDAS